MSDSTKLASSIRTVSIPELIMGNERDVTLQSTILGPEQIWTIVQVPAHEVTNMNEEPSFWFIDRVQLIDERYWNTPKIDDDAAMVYIVLRPHDPKDYRYCNIVRDLLGDELFRIEYGNSYMRILSERVVRNITRKLNASMPSGS